MLEVAWWGFVGSAALLVGAVIGVVWRVPPRAVGAVMAFSAGVLISAVAFELCRRTSRSPARLPVIAGTAAGALTFYLGDLAIDRRDGNDRRRGAAEAIVPPPVTGSPTA